MKSTSQSDPIEQNAQNQAQEAAIQIEQSLSDLKDQLQAGLQSAHEYLRIIRNPFVLFGSMLVAGVFIGETLSKHLDKQSSLNQDQVPFERE